MPAKFPHRDADGSFHIEVLLNGVGAESVTAIQSWLDDIWMPQNNTWTWVSRTGEGLATAREEVLNYFDEFLAPPEIAISENGLAIRFSGKSSAKWWRDWLAKFVADLKAQFPAAEVTKIRNSEIQ